MLHKTPGFRTQCYPIMLTILGSLR